MKSINNMLKRIFIVSLSILISPLNLYAYEKFKVDGDVLHYNTELAVDEIDKGIKEEDPDELLKILKNSLILKLFILRLGGLISAAVEMADMIIDFELDTHVKEICFSACPLLLIGGETRTLERSKIGFHRNSWGIDNESFMKIKTRELYGWKNEFDFSSWVYDDSQEIYSQFKYYLERGSPKFVIKTIARSEDG